MKRAWPFLVSAALGVGVWASVGIAPSRHTRIAGYATTLVGRTANQRHNAALALSHLKGAVVAPGEVFSFNDTVGSWSRDRGYRRAPVSYNGTLVDAWGGGVCQASTTVYNASLLAGLEVVRRFPHVFAPSYCPPGRDAAVAFGGVDLKVRNRLSVPITLRGKIVADQLMIWWEGPVGKVVTPQVVSSVDGFQRPTELIMRRQPADLAAYVRNSGKPGWEVSTFRVWGDRRELVSRDRYPVMDRIVEFR